MKITPAFRRYVRRVEQQALKAKLDAIRTLAAITLALAAMTTAHSASFTERFASATPDAPLASTPPADTPQQWNIKVLLLIDGKLVHSIDYGDHSFPSSDACRDAIMADKPLQASAQKAAKGAAKQFGPQATIAIACALDLN